MIKLYNETDQFDIIVLGMQEATFGAPNREHHHMVNGELIEVSDHSSRLHMIPDLVKNIPSVPIKKLQALQALTGPSRDHTRKQPPISHNTTTTSLSSSAVLSSSPIPSSRYSQQQQKLHQSPDHRQKIDSSELNDDSERGSMHATDPNNMNEKDDSLSRSERRSVAVKAQSNHILASPLRLLKKASFDMLATEWLDGTPVLHAMLDARLPNYRRVV
jgi:hypothetical protein